eukprot:CAMPEP_0181305852 /NCGR_PEP_ID=MMETSP1101-20121128/9964_1 /TAXON_ID=46948 /ORGANISM="Rhodomonas abbreviata, Strain Caron Lab Isolate" /LENGTH=37 /DNA_ID= /DNA_START= /DNA_END= /DNA_ORIENTATION=
MAASSSSAAQCRSPVAPHALSASAAAVLFASAATRSA